MPDAGVEALLVAATGGELGKVLAGLDLQEERSVAGRRLYTGRRGAVRVAAIVSGIGKANAAMATATVLQVLPARWTLCIGVGGVFPGNGLEVGELAVADAEYYGDEGVETDSEWQGLEHAGLPLWERLGQRWFNRLPVDGEGATALATAAAAVANTARGPFVTVSTVTGSAERAGELEKRFGALCESMEGAAVAHAALAAATRFVEVRGISNRVGPRQREAWQLDRAAEAAQLAAIGWLDTL